MFKYFDKKFFKIILGFSLVLAVSFAIFAFAGYYQQAHPVGPLCCQN